VLAPRKTLAPGKRLDWDGSDTPQEPDTTTVKALTPVEILPQPSPPWGSPGWPAEPQSNWQPVDANGVRYAGGSSSASQRRRSLQDQAHLRVSISGLGVRLAQPPIGVRYSHFPLQPVCQGCESYEIGGETTLSQAVLLARLPCKRERGCRIGMHFLLFCLAVEPNQPGDNRK
jgi:hypothetical protein